MALRHKLATAGALLALSFPGSSWADPPLLPVLPHGDATPGMPRSPFWQGVQGANDAVRDLGRPIVLGPLPIIANDPRFRPAAPRAPSTFQALTTMPQNWDAATGELMYSYQAIDVNPGANGRTANQMFTELASFQHFNPGNIATAQMVTAPAGDVGPNANRRFVMFRADPAVSVVGGLNFAQQFINSEWVPVEIFTDEQNHTITAVTMGDHMIVGVRRWTMKPNADGSYRIETEAWEQRNGMVNNVAMNTGVPLVLSGKEVMGMVWDRYLNNLGTRATQNGGTYQYAPGTNGESGLWRHRPRGTENPFRAGIPGSGVGGRMPAPGFFGPGFGAGDPTIARGIFHPADVGRNLPLLALDTAIHGDRALSATRNQLAGFGNDVAQIRRSAPWYRLPDQIGGAAGSRTASAALAVQNEFIQSDLNRRVALPLRHAAEETVAQVHDDFVATPLNQNYLLPARRVAELGTSLINQDLLARRRALTGNNLDWLFGGPGNAPPPPQAGNGAGGWNGGRNGATNPVANAPGGQAANQHNGHQR